MKKARVLSFLLVLVVLFASFNIPVAHAAPAAPSGLKASVMGSSSIKLTWKAVSGASKYEVYKGTSTSSMALAATITTATVTVTALTPSTTYYFKVRAVTSSGSAGAFSATVSAKTTAGIAAPTGVKAVSASSAQINLTWNAVSRASSYTVYRSASSAGTYTKIATVTVRSYNNTGLASNTAYYFKVRAVNSKGEGVYSAAVTARTRPAVPTGLKATALSTSSIKLTWTAVAGATRYIVYRCATATGTFAKVGEATTATYTNTGLAKSTTYYYKVSAVNSGGEGAKTAAVSAKTLSITPPPAPAKPVYVAANVEPSTMGSGYRKVSFNRNLQIIPGAVTNYKMYSSTNGTNWTLEYTDSGYNTGFWIDLPLGATYYLKFTALNGTSESVGDIHKFGVTDYPKSFVYKTYWDLVIGHTGKIELSWNACGGAALYEVKVFDLSSQLVAHTTTSATTVTFTNMPSYVTLYYYVYPINSEGIYGPICNNTYASIIGESGGWTP